jgi:hypothetical protein
MNYVCKEVLLYKPPDEKKLFLKPLLLLSTMFSLKKDEFDSNPKTFNI